MVINGDVNFIYDSLKCSFVLYLIIFLLHDENNFKILPSFAYYFLRFRKIKLIITRLEELFEIFTFMTE